MDESSPGLRLLEESRRLVAGGWCQGADARDTEGSAVDPWDADAVQWSLLGAIVAVLERATKASGEIPLDELASALHALAGLIDADSLSDWNDEPARAQGEVVNVLTAAASVYRPLLRSESHTDPN